MENERGDAQVAVIAGAPPESQTESLSAPESSDPELAAPSVAASAASPPVTTDADRGTELRQFFRSTPARLIVIGLVLMVLAIAAGGIASTAVSRRANTLDAVLARTEPLADSAQDLYSALSVADAAASSAFISGGLEPTEVRSRYSQAIADAAAQLVSAAGGLADSDASARNLLSRISAGLPVYSGLVETARANNRSGYPVGAAYLSEASTLMQGTLLPLAEQLHTEQANAVTSDQAGFSRPPLLPIGLIVASIFGLIAAQIFLARRTRRTLSVGFICATVCMSAMLIWVLTAGLLSAAATSRALSRGAEPLQTLTTSRILAQQARTDETLSLVRRGGTSDYDAQFASSIDRLEKLLATNFAALAPTANDEIRTAVTALTAWDSAHNQMNNSMNSGDFDGAVSVAIGPDPAFSAAQFSTVDSALSAAIEAARTELRNNVARSNEVLNGLTSGALALGIISGIAVGAALWPRLREYQ